MALEIYDGRPGDGKSYCAVATRILPHLMAGGFVATNIAMKPAGVAAYIKKRSGKIFNPSRLLILDNAEVPTFPKRIPQGTPDCPVLVILDEVHLWFNARDWAKTDAAVRETFVFATQHRKYCIDIVLISQHFANIDGQFVRLIAGLSRFRDLKRWHPPGMPWLRIPYFRFLAVHYDRNGKTVMRRDWVAFDPLVGAAYDTRAISGGEGTGGGVTGREALTMDPVVRKKLDRGLFLLRLCIILGALCLLGWLVWWRVRVVRDMDREEMAALRAELDRRTKAPAVLPVAPLVQGPTGQPSPSRPPGWLDEPPHVEVWSTRGGMRRGRVWELTVSIDGADQILTPGAWTTRGRVMNLIQLNPRLWSVFLSCDDGKRREFRVLRDNVGMAGAVFSSNPLSQRFPVPLPTAPITDIGMGDLNNTPKK